MTEMLKNFRASYEFQTGDTAFDDQIYVNTDDPEIHSFLRDSKQFRELLVSIFSNREVERIQLNPGHISVWISSSNPLAADPVLVYETYEAKELRSRILQVKLFLENSGIPFSLRMGNSGVRRGASILATVFVFTALASYLYYLVVITNSVGVVADTPKLIFLSLIFIPIFFLGTSAFSVKMLLRTAWAPYFLLPLLFMLLPSSMLVVPAGIRLINHDATEPAVEVQRRIHSYERKAVQTRGKTHIFCEVLADDIAKGSHQTRYSFPEDYCAELRAFSVSNFPIFFEYDLRRGRLGIAWYMRTEVVR